MGSMRMAVSTQAFTPAATKAVKDGMPEDEQKNSEAKLQKVHDKYIKQIDDMLAAKDKEIMTV